MALTSQLLRESVVHSRLAKRSSQHSSNLVIPEVQAVNVCCMEPRIVKLEQELYSLAKGNGNLQDTTDNCLALLPGRDNVKEVFNVFCSCSWMDRFVDPVISKLFYQLINAQEDSNAEHLLLDELEKSCEKLLKTLTHLEVPNSLQLKVVCLLYNLSRLKNLPQSHLEAVQSYMEEIARAFWPYSLPSAPDLWSSEAFCDALCDVLKACGKYLREKCPVNTERTLQKIHSKLISGDLSQYARFRLLEIRELCLSGWKVTEATSNYYKEVYQKLKNQSENNAAIINKSTSKSSDKVSSLHERTDQAIGKPMTVLRISEDQLRKSCDNVQEGVICCDTVAGERNLMVDQRSVASLHHIELTARPITSFSRIKEGLKNYYSQMERFGQLETETIISSKQQREKASFTNQSSIEDMLETKTQACSEGEKASPVTVSLDSSAGIKEPAPSLCCTNDADEVFSSKLDAEKVKPAMHRGDFTKPRRPFKRNSSSSSADESQMAETPLLSDSSVTNYTWESTTVTHPSTELVTLSDINNAASHLEVAALSAEVMTGSSDKDTSKAVVEENNRSKGSTESWEEIQTSSVIKFEKNQDVGSVSESWRERPTMDIAQTKSYSCSGASSSDNWRERKSYNSSDFQKNRSQINVNWRERKSLSLDETEKNKTSTQASYGQPKRYSYGDIKLERQDSNEKVKESPRGGFGLPKQASEELEGAPRDEQHHARKLEIAQVQLSEQESQNLRWWRLAEIQDDTGCKLYHYKEKCTVVIKGEDPLLCKVAKTRVYSAVAALQEEFGALVPLSNEILEHLQTEGRTMLAQRLSLCTAASVKMISDAQLFISGHRSSVHLAKQQLAKIKVMLKYIDDPDVASLSREDDNEEDIHKVNRLFAALDGTPKLLSQKDDSNEKQEVVAEGSLSREFLLSCASNPLALQRPADLSLERTEGWVTAIVLDNARRGEQVLLNQKKGFGTPSFESKSRLSSTEAP